MVTKRETQDRPRDESVEETYTSSQARGLTQDELLEIARKEQARLARAVFKSVRRDQAGTLRRFLMVKVGIARTADLMPLVEEVAASVPVEDILGDIMTARSFEEIEQILEARAEALREEAGDEPA